MHIFHLDGPCGQDKDTVWSKGARAWRFSSFLFFKIIYVRWLMALLDTTCISHFILEEGIPMSSSMSIECW